MEQILGSYPTVRAAEQALGVTDTLLRRWRGRNRPRLPQLIDLSFKLLKPPHLLLSQSISPSPTHAPEGTPSIQKAISPNQYNATKLQKEIKTYLIESGSHGSVKGLCRKLKITEGYFRYHWPIIAQELAQRCLENQQTDDARARQELLEITLRRLAYLNSKGHFIGTRQLRQLMAGYRGFKRLSHRMLRRIRTNSHFGDEYRRHSELLTAWECEMFPPSTETEDTDSC